jgi:nitrate/TMAO reductase-like tetraheme cytochrome c subunit
MFYNPNDRRASDVIAISYAFSAHGSPMNSTLKTPGWFLLTRHWLSLLGVALILTALISSLFIAPQEVRVNASNPYTGILLVGVIPVLFLAGLALVPIGVYLSKREIAKQVSETTFDRRASLRRLAIFLGVTGIFNVVLGTQLTYRAVKHMETPQFCGTSCHSMKPEFTAFQNSPHSRLECVECHVAPGAAGWIASKTNGMRQLVQTVTNSEPRPVPSALESNRLVPARETCENCHWPDKFGGARLRVFTKYAEDEANTRSQTVLLMMIGGNSIAGIHGAHVGPGVHVRYTSQDRARQRITTVEYRNTQAGQSRTYVAPGVPANSGTAKYQFEMQCVDCHNRPTHNFDLPERAVDKALATGEIPVTLPMIKKKGVELLKASYSSSEEAASKIMHGLASFYQHAYPQFFGTRAQDISRAGHALVAIYGRNVFPDLKVTWGTYPDHLGHTDSPGCFRCHDGLHNAPDGTTISQDCSICHEALAIEETAPDILKTLGIADRLASLEKK